MLFLVFPFRTVDVFLIKHLISIWFWHLLRILTDWQALHSRLPWEQSVNTVMLICCLSMNSRNTLDSRVFKSLQVFVFYGVFKMVTIKIKTQQWNYSKSHTPGLKQTYTCTSHWHSHSETTPNPTPQDSNIPALVLHIDTPTLKLLQIPHSRTQIYLHLHFAVTLPLWNCSKSHTPGLKHTCTCTSHWHSHSETTANPTLQEWNIPALVLCIDTHSETIPRGCTHCKILHKYCVFLVLYTF